MDKSCLRTKRATMFSCFAAQFAVLVLGSSAMAGTTYVSKSGADSNVCTSPLTPCLTIGQALTQATSAGGFNRIVITGAGIFGEAVTLTSSAEIVGDGAHFQGIAPGAGNNAITISGGTNDSYRIGYIQLLGSSNAAAIGLDILSAATVNIENVEIHGFGTNALSFTPSGYQYPTLTIKNSVIGDGSGVLVRPTTAQYPNVQIDNSTIRNCNSYCLRADATAMSSGSFLNVNIINSTLYNASTNDLTVQTTGSTGFASVVVEGSTASYAGVTGVNANGPNTNLSLDRSVIISNTTGVASEAGGTVISYGNNNISNNTTNESGVVTTVPLK